MKKSRLLGAICAGVFGFISISANAALIPRLGGQAYYDDVLDVTWLADANYARSELSDSRVAEIIANNTITFSDGHALTQNEYYHDFATDNLGNYSGLMTWWASIAWVDQLIFGGHDDWRLATTLYPDTSCTNRPMDPTQYGPYENCTGSELGFMYYINLGLNYVNSSDDDPGGIQTEIDKFSNVEYTYWTETESTIDSVWIFQMANGGTGWAYKQGTYGTRHHAAWAVADGDVFQSSVVPITPALWLFGSGLLGLVGIARRKKTA